MLKYKIYRLETQRVTNVTVQVQRPSVAEFPVFLGRSLFSSIQAFS